MEVLPGFIEVFARVGHPTSGPKALAQGASGHVGESLFLLEERGPQLQQRVDTAFPPQPASQVPGLRAPRRQVQAGCAERPSPGQPAPERELSLSSNGDGGCGSHTSRAHQAAGRPQPPPSPTSHPFMTRLRKHLALVGAQTGGEFSR